MNLQLVIRIRFIFFLLGFLQSPGYSVAEDDLCLPPCFKSGNLIHEYISELKEEIREKNVELRKAQDYAKNKLINRLRTENEDLRKILWEFSQQRNTIARIASYIIDLMIKQANEIKEGKLKAAKNQIDLKKHLEELRKIALNVKNQMVNKPTSNIEIKINNHNQMERKPRSQSEMEMNLNKKKLKSNQNQMDSKPRSQSEVEMHLNKDIETLKKNLEKENANRSNTLKTPESKKME